MSSLFDSAKTAAVPAGGGGAGLASATPYGAIAGAASGALTGLAAAAMQDSPLSQSGSIRSQTNQTVQHGDFNYTRDSAGARITGGSKTSSAAASNDEGGIGSVPWYVWAGGGVVALLGLYLVLRKG